MESMFNAHEFALTQYQRLGAFLLSSLGYQSQHSNNGSHHLHKTVPLAFPFG